VTAELLDLHDPCLRHMEATVLAVGATAEVGRLRVVKTESKGKGNKRIRIEVLDG